MPGGKGGQDINIDADDVKRAVPDILTGGFNIRVGKRGTNTGKQGNKIYGGSTPKRLGYVRNIADAFGARADELGVLKDELRPGFGRLTTSRLNELEDERKRRIGNLAQQLSRRRILGSNFARDEISREETAFTRERDRITAESTLAEIAASVDIIGQEYASRAQQFQTFLDNMNLEANIALSLAGQASAAYTGLQQSAMQLEAQSKSSSAEGINSLVGNILGQGTQLGFDYLAPPLQIQTLAPPLQTQTKAR